jgi:hypothetical protein
MLDYRSVGASRMGCGKRSWCLVWIAEQELLHVHLKFRRAERELHVAETVIALWGPVVEEIKA